MQIEVADLGTVNYEEDELLYFIEEPMISFVLINPFMFVSDYEPNPSKEDMEELVARNMEDISFYVICSLKADIKESTLNLKCPIAVNALTKNAKQLILEDGKYQLRHRFGDYDINSLSKED